MKIGPSNSTAVLGCTLLCFLTVSLSVLGPVRAAEEGLPKNTVSLGIGFPMPVGGILGLEWLHRIDERNFVMLGGGSAVFLHGTYLSYGRRFAGGTQSAWYTYGGFDGNIFTVWGSSRQLPGAHLGIGKEWFPGSARLSLSGAIGFPWLGGLRFTVGF